MDPTNDDLLAHLRISVCLRVFGDHVQPWVVRVMSDQAGTRWWNRLLRPSGGPDYDPYDPYVLMQALRRHWDWFAVGSDPEGSYRDSVTRLLDIRNRWAHWAPLTAEDVAAAKECVIGLCGLAGADVEEEIDSKSRFTGPDAADRIGRAVEETLETADDPPPEALAALEGLASRVDADLTIARAVIDGLEADSWSVTDLDRWIGKGRNAGVKHLKDALERGAVVRVDESQVARHGLAVDLRAWMWQVAANGLLQPFASAGDARDFAVTRTHSAILAGQGRAAAIRVTDVLGPMLLSLIAELDRSGLATRSHAAWCAFNAAEQASVGLRTWFGEPDGVARVVGCAADLFGSPTPSNANRLTDALDAAGPVGGEALTWWTTKLHQRLGGIGPRDVVTGDRHKGWSKYRNVVMRSVANTVATLGSRGTDPLSGGPWTPLVWIDEEVVARLRAETG
ncbi:hypothetical protein DVS28_b0085 (plasmid) [Euzebya pacifica]|uniref:Swt1-like HEPN domain-containing protein n=1 Tax=Euzebya pacifica TaxID=1608957 RepID=A0A346Y5V8_9ACTN|nr:Swt1 family HEPN domain-containing protein [Euzebya pacifica]AXV09855.1 hypothetical protein DVS28_b0085 [Euzebya pacifica]